MKYILSIACFLFLSLGFAQISEAERISKLKTELEVLATQVDGLNEVYKTEISVTNLSITNLLLAIAEVHQLNINPAQELNSMTISPSFPDVVVSDLLLFLCKEYRLTIDLTGTIMAVKKYVPPAQTPDIRVVPVVYNPNDKTISIDAKEDALYEVFKRIMDKSDKNLVYKPGLENRPITAYFQNMPFPTAMKNLALANNLYVQQSKDGIYVFEDDTPVTSNSNQNTNTGRPRSSRPRNSNLTFKVRNIDKQLLDVDFINTPISDIINDIGEALNIDVFTATPLEEAGNATFKARKITFDELLTKLFEAQAITTGSVNNRSPLQNQNPQNNITSGNTAVFTFKKESNIYFFGTENQLSVREVAIIHLQHRSVELLSDPSGGISNRSAGRSLGTNQFGTNGVNNRNFNQNGTGISNPNNTSFNNNRNRQPINTNSRGAFNSFSNQAEALVNILPDEIKLDLDIKVDVELNSFYVNGPSAKIERFRSFIKKIDKPVPVVLIEVMILEVSRTSSVRTGVSWGLGTEPTTTQGSLFPETNLTLGATTINNVIGGFDGFGSLNIGKVVPNFFATIEAMEENGDLKIRSTPKLSTLNGHRATFSNGQTSYYTVTDQAVIGADNPVTQTAVNFVPIDAELGITIKPLVSGDGQVTLDIFVVQSNFGNRISDDAPPDINSREFSSIIRVKDQDIVVLGGLEEQSKNNSGSGVPFLARIPIIKWFFSKRVREGRKAKLTVLIKPTVINN